MIRNITRNFRPNRRAQAIAATLLLGLLLGAPEPLAAMAHAGSVRNLTLTPRRIAASASVIVAFIGATAGALALARGRNREISTRMARQYPLLAIVSAPIGFFGGALTVATAKGGLGTGNGLAGGVVAMLVGVAGLTLGALAFATSRRPRVL